MGRGVLAQYLRRTVAGERARRARPMVQLALRVDIGALCFELQRRLIEDEADQVIALCGRRAGKSSAGRILVVKAAVEHAGSRVVLIAPTRADAKRLHWSKLQRLLRDLDIGFIRNGTDLILRLTNGSEIWLGGAKDATQIERLRGHDFKLVVIDEAQSIRDDVLRVLVEDVLQWALVDHQGRLVVLGTPPLVPVGWFVERYQGRDAKGRDVVGWSRHHWTIFDNERMPGGQAAVATYLAKLRLARGISEGSVTWRREVLGELVLDTDQLVLNAFDLVESVYLPHQLPEGIPTVVLGIDVGYSDRDSIIALGRFPASNDLWVVDEWEKEHQTEEQLAAKVKEFVERWHPIAKVIDTGGNAKTAAGISQRLGMDIEPAHKPGVVIQFQRVNDEFRARRLRVPEGGNCAHDAVRMAWAPGKIGQQVAQQPHSDALPALSYAYSRMSRYVAPEPVDQTPQLTPQEQRYLDQIARYRKAAQQ